MPFENSTVRWGIGLAETAIIAAIGVFLLEGTLQLLVLAIAVLSGVTTPWILKQAAEADQ